jgi:uncharacterized protein YbcC (UPF0753/DUF2309 family)
LEKPRAERRIELVSTTDAKAHGSQPLSFEAAVDAALDEAGHLLPDQAPIRVFIHHNTLHAFQHLHFHDAVLRGQETYGAEPYLSEERFRRELDKGRIRVADIDHALADQYPEESAEELIPGLSEARLRRLLMLHVSEEASAAQLEWLEAEGKLTQKLRADLAPESRRALLAASEGDEARAASSLWETCLARARDSALVPSPRPAPVILHRDLVLELSGVDVFDQLFPVLIRLSGAYLDDGVAEWTMPGRERGFYLVARELAANEVVPLGRFFAEAKHSFAAQRSKNLSARQAALELLRELGLGNDDVGPYLKALLLTLPGWAGMMSRLERHPEDSSAGAPPASLMDFLAVRLTYEQAALRSVLAEHASQPRSLAQLYRERRTQRLSSSARSREPERLAFQLFQLAQLAGIAAEPLREARRVEVERLLTALMAFDGLKRRRVFQEAYEHHHRSEVLSAVADQRQHARLDASEARPRFQLVSCFDEREESFRRHVEEVAPDCQTFGAPGFFGAAMRFRAMDEAQHVPLAPVLIKPTHLIEERPAHGHSNFYEVRLARRVRWARVGTQLQRGTRSFWRGMALNAGFGIVALFPLLTRLLSPRLAGRIRSALAERFFPAPRTELTVHHDDATTLPPGVAQRGFKVDERVIRVATVLENIGLTGAFARLVLVLGHGSTTLNNPHKSAYDCGACGGRQGGPNARVFCQMANDPEVRHGLAQRGIMIPDDTWFIGGQHDTCDDEVTLLDAASCPESHRELFREVVLNIDKARARNAQERCRRLFSAPRDARPRQALRHVEGRAEHLAEPRPEFGHATNAVAVIGRRALTRGLFLDRRAFLLSYDPGIDPQGSILERTLAAATPVGAGINLEYYFSHVDNERYGAGSKLPHNITGLFGVMSGHASDLRTGLPRQMIEIHEPVRLLVIVEATPSLLLDIASRQAEVKELVVNRWIQLVSLHPETGAMQIFTDRGFVAFEPAPAHLREGARSEELFRGHHDFVPPARILERVA